MRDAVNEQEESKQAGREGNQQDSQTVLISASTSHGLTMRISLQQRAGALLIDAVNTGDLSCFSVVDVDAIGAVG